MEQAPNVDLGSAGFTMLVEATARVAPTLKVGVNADIRNLNPTFEVDLRDTGITMAVPPTLEFHEDILDAGTSITLNVTLGLDIRLYDPTVTAENMPTVVDCEHSRTLSPGGLGALTGTVDVVVECAVGSSGGSITCKIATRPGAAAA